MQLCSKLTIKINIIANIGYPEKYARLYIIKGDIIIHSGITKEIIAYIPAVIRVKFLFKKKYESAEKIIEITIIIINVVEKKFILFNIDADKIQYANIINWATGKIYPSF